MIKFNFQKFISLLHQSVIEDSANMNESRRDFIKSSSALLTLGTLSSACGHIDQYFGPDREKLKKEVVIIGAGAAGLMAALTLKKNQIPYKIFEAASRVGGRAYTLKSFYNGTSVELGAEEVSIEHKLVQQLAKEFDLSLQSNSNKEKSTYFYFIDEKKYTEVEIAKILKPLTLKLLELNVSEETAHNFDINSLEQWLLSQKGSLSPDAILIFSAVVRNHWGVGPEEISFLEVLLCVQKGLQQRLESEHEVLTFENGMSDFIESFYERVSGVATDFLIKFQHHLLGVSLEDGVKILNFQTSQGQKIIRAQNVIFALPLSQYSKIQGLDVFLNENQKKYLHTNNSFGDLGKIFLGIKDSFWFKKVAKTYLRLNYFNFKMNVFGKSSLKRIAGSDVLTFEKVCLKSELKGPELLVRVQTDLKNQFKDFKSEMIEKSELYFWSQNAFIQGAKSYQKPGWMLSSKALWAEVVSADGFVFVGEHTADAHLRNSLEGALVSGKLGAERMIEQMKNSNSSFLSI